ncbi:MAG TPA: sugar ABC transporter permease [Bacteroidota bacterium]|jgi:ABC-type sugar transport system permease subunit|nr:sugar ABC transporter permease [Bacteroidota bacterium]
MIRKFLHKFRASDRNSYWFISPYVIFFLAFTAYPLIFSFILMFHRWNIVSPMEWVGLKNFERLVLDSLFLKSLGNTVMFLLIHIPLQIVVALGFALLLHSRVRFRGLFRALYFLPVVVSGVVVTILWQQLYSYDYGVLNSVLSSLGLPRMPWLVDASFAMPSIALMATWKNVGIYIILFLVGLQDIPSELYEAAAIDGASRSKQFFRITLPMLNPTMIVIMVLSTIGGFSLFIEPYVMTGGGPMQSTLSGMLYIYNQAFYFNHMGYAATLGFALALVILAVVVIQRKVIEKDSVA